MNYTIIMLHTGQNLRSTHESSGDTEHEAVQKVIDKLKKQYWKIHKYTENGQYVRGLGHLKLPYVVYEVTKN